MRIYFTIDTETSMGGAWKNSSWQPLPLNRTIFGETPAGTFGIPLIMDILEQHGFRGTFFTEVFCTYNLGFEPLAKVFRYIRERGHEAQLHLHPEQRFYREYRNGGPHREQPLLYTFPFEEQRELIADGCRIFRELSGAPPVAFRAGCYGASEVTLRALFENGIQVDSSHNAAYLGRSCGFRRPLLNTPTVIEGVHEFPATNFSPGRAGVYKPLEISAVSAFEVLATIRALRKTGCQDVVLVLHSFSLLKNRGIRFENCRPDRIVISRLRRVCAGISQMRGEVEVCVLGEARTAAAPAPESVPNLGWFRPAVRKAVQALDYVPWL